MELQEKSVVDKMKYNIVIACTSLAILLLVVVQPAFAVSNACPCIVFRLDDIQAYYLSNVQTKIMGEFQKKNASLTIGIIGYDFTKDQKTVSYIKENLKKGHSQIEIANHGWKHENFADLPQSQQVSLMNKTNQELLKTFGKKPTVFITPYNLFNNYTLKALQQLKMKVISSGITQDMNKYVTVKGKIVLNKDLEGLYHIPSMTDFQIDIGNETLWSKIPKDKVIASINSHISKIGYDVVLLHPQNFAKIENGTYVDTVDSTEISELGSLIDYAKSKHIRITTLSDILGLGMQKSHVKTKLTNGTTSLTTKLTNGTTSPTIPPKIALNATNKTVTNTVVNSGPTGTVAVNMRYPGGDRVEYQLVSMRVYQDSNPVPYQQINSITGNPFDITLLPLGHQYKIETYVEGMLSSTDYVDLENKQQELDVGIPNGGSIRVTTLYHDGQTPLANATVTVKSQDNTTRDSGVTDPDGQTVRFYLASTNVDNNYYNIDVKVSDHLSYSYQSVSLPADNAQEIKIVTPWPPLIDSLFVVKAYNQTQLLTSSNGNYVIALFDSSGGQVSKSKINIHGDAYFWNLKVGDYVFKVISGINGRELGISKVTLDGSQTNFNIMLNQNKQLKTTNLSANMVSLNNSTKTMFKSPSTKE
jgi:peptidoglycan/xylan/chitin deacetylase (PgdA/CDA1 family)